MKQELSESELLYIDEHLSCQNYMTSIDRGFKYLELTENCEFNEEHTSKNYLLFFLKGEFILHYGQFHNRIFHAGNMVLIPRSSHLKITPQTDSLLLSMFFDTPEGNCDKQVLQSLSEICKKIEYNFESVVIRYPLTAYLEILTYCLKNKMNCLHLHHLMQQEFFFLLRGFYTKQEIAILFYPIIGKEIDFKDFVLRNYTKVNSIEQLISLSNMGRSSFFTKFNKVFGMTAKQWILKQKDQQILERIMESRVCIKDIVEEFGFDSPINFTRYCKQHFGDTPKRLIARYQADKENI